MPQFEIPRVEQARPEGLASLHPGHRGTQDMPGRCQLEHRAAPQGKWMTKGNLPDFRALGGSCLQELCRWRTCQNLIVSGEMIEVGVGNKSPPLRSLGIHPKIHLRKKESPLFGFDHPIGGAGDRFHWCRIYTNPATSGLTFLTKRSTCPDFFAAVPFFSFFHSKFHIFFIFLIICYSTFYEYF